MAASAAQLALAEKHGTPAQFETACWRAYCDLFVTYEEVVAAVEKYRCEWDEAADRLPAIGESPQ